PLTPVLFEGERLRRRSLDRVARIEQENRPPLRAHGGNGRRHAGESLSKLPVRDLVVRIDMAVEIGRMQDRQSSGRRRARESAEKRGESAAEKKRDSDVGVPSRASSQSRRREPVNATEVVQKQQS